MYTIYADGKPLYAPHLFHEGCGVLSPTLTVELNKAGSLQFTIPPTNSLYDEVRKLKTMVTVYQNGDELFKGRVLHDEKDFYKRKKTYCEGGLAFLLDSVQRPYSYSGDAAELFRRFINNHNSRVDADKQFVIGEVTVSGKISCNNSGYTTTFDEINAQIIDVVGGYMRVRTVNDKNYIDLIANPENGKETITNSQIIEFGVNLLDLSEHITAENIFTVLIPVGATIEKGGETTDEKLTIASENNGKDYLENTSAIELFGRIERVEEWSEVTNAAQLKQLGIDLLKKNIETATTLTLRVVDLHLLNVDVERIRLGDWFRVISLPHGIGLDPERDPLFQCTKITYNLESPDQSEYTFGANFRSLTDQQVSNKKTFQSSVSMVVSTAGAVNASVGKVNQASQDINYVITQMPTDYVKSSTFEDYKTETASELESINADIIDLKTRLEALEGGTI